jgi:hypothetical protein
MVHASTSTDDFRFRRAAPDAQAILGAEVLGIAHVKRRTRASEKAGLRYGWFANRNPTLRAVGRVAQEHGPICARMAADAVLARIAEGLAPTTREAVFVVREAAHRLANVAAVNGTRGQG